MAARSQVGAGLGASPAAVGKVQLAGHFDIPARGLGADAVEHAVIELVNQIRPSSSRSRCRATWARRSTSRISDRAIASPGHPPARDLSRMSVRFAGWVMATVKQVQVTFDCANPRAVAEFGRPCSGTSTLRSHGFDSWDAFDASLPVESQGWTWVCQGPDGAGPRLFFQRVPEAKTVKNRLHLDVRVGLADRRRASLCA
jgi:hypothetical protein